MPEQQGTEHIPQGKWQQVTAHILLGHGIEAHQDQRVSEKDRVVKESLRHHQHKTEKRAPAMLANNRVPNLMPGRMCAGLHTRYEQVCGAVAAVADRGRAGADGSGYKNRS